MILASCGDSFLTSSKEFYDTFAGADWPKFTLGDEQEKSQDPIIQNEIEINYKIHIHNPSVGDIIAENYNFEHRNYSRSGCDNIEIRQQIDEAILQGATHVLLCCTDPTRIWNSHKYPEAYKTYLKYLTTEKREIDRDRYIIRDAIRTLEDCEIRYIFMPGNPAIRDLDWTWCKDYVYPNTAPQLWDVLTDRNHPNRSTRGYYYNHNTWEVNSRIAQVVIGQLDWN